MRKTKGVIAVVGADSTCATTIAIIAHVVGSVSVVSVFTVELFNVAVSMIDGSSTAARGGLEATDVGCTGRWCSWKPTVAMAKGKIRIPCTTVVGATTATPAEKERKRERGQRTSKNK